MLILFYENPGKNAPGDQVREMYDLVNSWSAAQQFLSDLYVTWPLILLMSFCALGKLEFIEVRMATNVKFESF